MLTDTAEKQRPGRVLRGGLGGHHLRHPIPGLLLHRPQILPHLHQQTQEPTQVCALVEVARLALHAHTVSLRATAEQTNEELKKHSSLFMLD